MSVMATWPFRLRAQSKDESEIAGSGPAVLSNVFFVSVTSDGVRITFTEQMSQGSTPHFRSAVLLSSANAFELVALLTRLLLGQPAQVAAESGRRSPAHEPKATKRTRKLPVDHKKPSRQKRRETERTRELTA
jgi:hypothetical protein